MPPFTISCVSYTVRADYSATWRFHCCPVTVWRTGMVCSSYIVKHLLKPPLQGVRMSAFACVWHLHGHYCSPPYEQSPLRTGGLQLPTRKPSGWTSVCVDRRDKGDRPRGQRGPQVDFREWERQLAQRRVCTGPEWDFREEGCSLSDTAGSPRDTLPSETPLQGQ